MRREPPHRLLQTVEAEQAGDRHGHRLLVYRRADRLGGRAPHVRGVGRAQALSAYAVELVAGVIPLGEGPAGLGVEDERGQGEGVGVVLVRPARLAGARRTRAS